MQKNDLTLNKTNAAPQLFNLITLVSALTTYLSKTSTVVALSKFYAFLFEKDFTPRQTVYTLYAQVSILLALLPFSLSLGWRTLFFVWFCQAFYRSGILRMLKKDE